MLLNLLVVVFPVSKVDGILAGMKNQLAHNASSPAIYGGIISIYGVVDLLEFADFQMAVRLRDGH